MGRARKVTGPFLDNMGIDMLQGGGKLFVGSSGRFIGPGHFGLLDLGDGVQKFSLPLRGRPRSRRHQRARHPPAAVARRLAGGRRQLHGRHVPDRIRANGHRARARRPGHARRRFPRQGWPRRREAVALAEAVAREAARPRTHPAAGRRSGRGELAGRRRRCAHVAVHGAGPAEVGDRAVANAGGYPGSPYFKITIAGTDRALAATADGELVAVPGFTGGPEQLWRIDQLTDGTYRVMPKAMPNCEGTAGAVRRRQQQADARQIQGRQRSAALAAQDAVSGSSTTQGIS